MNDLKEKALTLLREQQCEYGWEQDIRAVTAGCSGT